MKKLLLLAILLIPVLNVNGQGIGQLAPPKPPETFPPHAWGVDIMFNESGFGLGTFYRYNFSDIITGYADLSFSEIKDPREFTYIDYWGQPYTLGKVNRGFVVPLFVGMQYRLFENVIYDNLRPYINFAFGPTLVLTDPYEQEFFSAFGRAHANYTIGGYVGFGANFGIDKSNLIGINIRYYIIHLFNGGIELMQGRMEKEVGGIYLTLNLGLMY